MIERLQRIIQQRIGDAVLETVARLVQAGLRVVAMAEMKVAGSDGISTEKAIPTPARDLCRERGA